MTPISQVLSPEFKLIFQVSVDFLFREQNNKCKDSKCTHVQELTVSLTFYTT